MTSFGATLKREREARQVTLREISEATKINLRYLEALEDNRFDILPGGVFNRGFVRAYAIHIGTDSDAMVALYLREVAARQAPPAAPSVAPGAAADPAPAAGPVAAPAAGSSAAPRATPAGAGQWPGRQFAPPRLEKNRPPAISSIDDAAPPSRLSRALVATLWIVAGVTAVTFGLSQFNTRRTPVTTDLFSTVPGQTVSPADAAADISSQDPGTEASRDATTPASFPDARPGEGAASVAAIAGPRVPAGEPQSPPPARDPPAPPPAGSAPTAAPPTSSAPTPPVASRTADGSRRPTEAGGEEAVGPMALRVETSRPTWVWVQCDWKQVIDRVVAPGETLGFECLSVIRVSAPQNAGTIQLRINDAPCLPLGEEGTRVYGYTIRIDDFHRICPQRRRATGDRP